jgi:hypothetical protein
MIDAERAPGRLPADGADAVLLVEQLPVLLGAEAVDLAQACTRVLLAIGGIRSPLVAPQRVEPLAVLRAIGAVGGELLLAMLGILGVSPPVLFVAESHPPSPQPASLDRLAPPRRHAKSPWLAGRKAAQEGREAYECAVEALKGAAPSARAQARAR